MLDLKPLSQQVSELFRKLGAIEALVLTTYGLDVSYLERFILPSFFPALGEGPASAPYLPVFEYLEEHPSLPISVLYDADNLVQRERSVGPASMVEKLLRWQAHPLRGGRGGVFHPKLILALVREEDGSRRIALGCASANLTRPGWGLNFEVCALETLLLAERAQNPLHGDLLDLVDSLVTLAPESVALSRIREAINTHHDSTRRWKRKRESAYRTRLWHSGTGQSLWPWLKRQVLRRDLSSEDGWHLEVLSPYFSKEVPALVRHAAEHVVGSVRCLLPDDGEHYAVDRDVLHAWNDAVQPVWSELPDDVLRSRLKDADGNPQRRLMHAKVYRFWKADVEMLVVGSANATIQGHLESGQGNEEACLVFSQEGDTEHPLKAWLKPLDEAPDPARCRAQVQASEDLPPTQRCPPVRSTFDWEQDRLKIENREPGESVLVLVGSEAIHLEPGGSLERSAAPEIRAAFYRSPTVRVAYANALEHQWLCLVEELGLGSKPPAPIFERDADALIQDWLMIPEDRLAHRMAEVARQEAEDAQGRAPEVGRASDSDRLNDLFLAVHRFRSNAEGVLQDGDDPLELDRLRVRLFGEGATSIRYFVKKLQQAATPSEDDAPAQFDSVNHYVALLTLIDAVERLQPLIHKQGWAFDTKQLMSVLRQRLRSVGKRLQQEIRLMPDATADPQQLLDWVERSFRFHRDQA